MSAFLWWTAWPAGVGARSLVLLRITTAILRQVCTTIYARCRMWSVSPGSLPREIECDADKATSAAAKNFTNDTGKRMHVVV